MNILAFFFAILGAALNFFQPVVRSTVSGLVFTGSMYDAVRTIIINGLPGEGGTILVILILVLLSFVPVSAAVTGLFIPFSEDKELWRKRIGIILCLCAIANVLAAWVIHYLSSEIFASPFLTNYVAPYVQKISFIIPAVCAVFYFIAGVLVLRQPQKKNTSKRIDGPSVVFGIGWAKKNQAECDLDASALLFDSTKHYLDDETVDVFKASEKTSRAIVNKSGTVWSTGDVTRGDIKADGSGNDLEQIIVMLDEIPKKVHKIIFTVTSNNEFFGHASMAHARLVHKVTLGDDHINDKTLRVSREAGEERLNISLADEKFKSINALIVGELEREGKGWVWNLTQEPLKGGFDSVCKYYGIPTNN